MYEAGIASQGFLATDYRGYQYISSMRWGVTIAIVMSIAAATLLVNACRKSTHGRFPAPTPMPVPIPLDFPTPVYDFEQYPVTEEGFALGRKLFHENRLSKYLDVTCGSCHQQHAAYTTFDHDLGHGTNHQHTTRNVPVIFNMAWQHEFEWDGRVPSLQEQMLSCLVASEKMDMQEGEAIAMLGGQAEYRELFGKAFGDENISGERIASALAQFVASLVSADSKYDRVKKGDAVFNSSEALGYALFQQHCNSCHAEPLFTDLSYRNNGLTINPYHADYGRMEVTGRREDSLKFKVPTLRNVMLTGYFAHDGRFVAVSEFLNHYSAGIVPSPTLDPLLAGGIPLSNLEKFYLQEFLFTLTDSTLISNPKFDAP